MPLPPTVEREELHQRTISMKVFRRKDGLYDVEAHLVDTKPFAFERVNRPDLLPAGQPLHDLWVRLVLDDQQTLLAVEAASDTTPFAICPQAGASLSVLVGARIGKGWSKLRTTTPPKGRQLHASRRAADADGHHRIDGDSRRPTDRRALPAR